MYVLSRLICLVGFVSRSESSSAYAAISCCLDLGAVINSPDYHNANTYMYTGIPVIPVPVQPHWQCYSGGLPEYIPHPPIVLWKLIYLLINVICHDFYEQTQMT